MDTVLLIHAESALAAIPWAQRLAGGARRSLVLLVFTQDPVHDMDTVSEAGPDAPGLLQKVFAWLSEQPVAGARVVDCRGPRPRRVVLNALSDLSAGQVVLHEPLGTAPMVSANLVRKIARAAPYDVLLLDCGDSPGPPRRVLFAQAGGGGTHGLRFAARQVCGPDVPLLVMPDPKAPGASRRSLNKAKAELERLGADHRSVLDAPESLEDGLAAEARSGDLVMADADESRRLNRLLGVLRKLRSENPELGVAVAVTRSAHAAGPGAIERVMERFHAHVPRLERDQRRKLSEDLEAGGRLSADFVIMLMLSAVIAALGLIQNSTAVVIGGMLVAPLMVPMLAMGLSLVQGNALLFRQAFKAMAAGVVGALAAAMLVGALSPWDDLSAEVVARGGPNVFDLAVALFSGIAAAFALARPGLAGTLVGVAVAVALVPPLAATGIALVKQEFSVALGAAVLFVVNWLAIVLGASLVFRLFGLDVSLGGSRAPVWVHLTFGGFALAMVPTLLLLFHNLDLQVDDGVHRPYARPLPSHVRAAVRARIQREPGVEIVTMNQSDIEHGFGREVVLAVSGPVSPGLRRELTAILENGNGGDLPVRVQLLRAVDE